MNEYADRYCDYFSNLLSQIQSLSSNSTGSADLFKRILFCTFIDTIAIAVFPKEEGVRKRFISLVKEFGRWKDQDRISLLHLVRFLDLHKDPVFDGVREFALKKYPRIIINKVLISIDPSIAEVQQYWPKKYSSGKFNGLLLEHFTHVHLLYSCRNILIHESRTPGYGISMKNDNEPFYHSMFVIDEESSEIDERTPCEIELVYPLGFVTQLCETILIGIKKHFEENELNPYDSYKFGSYWIKELN